MGCCRVLVLTSKISQSARSDAHTLIVRHSHTSPSHFSTLFMLERRDTLLNVHSYPHLTTGGRRGGGRRKGDKMYYRTTPTHDLVCIAKDYQLSQLSPMQGQV